MSLQVLAQDMASRGRGPDTMLVHMAPQEVAGLQALAMAHGGSLTLNPDTGLPEAGFLQKILPTLIGAGLTLIPGVGPLMAAGIVGGGTALATGSLKKGLAAGLGAYGGAGLGSALAGAGAAQGLGAASAEAAAAGNAAAASQAANPTLMAQFAEAGISPADAAISASEFAANSMGLPGGPAFSAATQSAMSNPLLAGAKGLGNEAGRSAFMEQVGGATGLAKYGLPVLSSLSASEPGAGYEGSGPNPYEYTYDSRTGTYTRVPTGTRDRMLTSPPMFPTTTPAPRMAMGGPVEEMSERNQYETLMANGGQMYAGGGMSHLGDYSDGGRLLRGPGDGVSDSIPAVIADKQPARLADGEFVVPARIVSELGNGSTEAGARKLYAMMDRVQKARGKTVGKDKAAVNTRADRLLPA